VCTSAVVVPKLTHSFRRKTLRQIDVDSVARRQVSYQSYVG